jgi:hypothetical protein
MLRILPHDPILSTFVLYMYLGTLPHAIGRPLSLVWQYSLFSDVAMYEGHKLP